MSLQAMGRLVRRNHYIQFTDVHNSPRLLLLFHRTGCGTYDGSVM